MHVFVLNLKFIGYCCEQVCYSLFGKKIEEIDPSLVPTSVGPEEAVDTFVVHIGARPEEAIDPSLVLIGVGPLQAIDPSIQDCQIYGLESSGGDSQRLRF